VDVPACDPSASTMGRIADAAPLISVGKPVVASAGVTDPDKVTDGVYTHAGASMPAASLPGTIAINVGAGPTRLLLSWADVGWNDYNTPAPGQSPGAYRIETSGDTTNGTDGTWDVVVTVADNPVRERAHAFAFAGKSWVRVVVTAVAKPAGAAMMPAGVTFDEIALYDVSAVVTGRPDDTWFFMGDSITVNAFRRQLGVGTGFDEQVHAARPDFRPALLDGGIGGELSNMGVQHIDDWLALNPDLQHVALMYGTNDSWGDKSPSTTTFEENMTTIIQKVLAAGRVPIIARIPYSAQATKTLPGFNAIVDRLSTDNGLPCGPDFYAWFATHPDQLGPDGVHPSEDGYRSMNRLWAEAMLRLYPAP